MSGARVRSTVTRPPNELTDVGIRVERWRKKAGLGVSGLVAAANEMLAPDGRLDTKAYWAFVRGQSRITESQIRAVARSLGTTVHVMTYYSPGHVPEEERAGGAKGAQTIKIHASAERAERKWKTQGTPKPKPRPAPRPYDADEAARLLTEKYGDKVRRM